jgi:hypothetical protein
MEEVPHPSILSREESRAHVEQHLAKQTALLRDLANYGANLVLRAYNSSDKQTVDAVVCGVFLKQVAMMVDATEVLLTSGCGLSAFLPARSAFEASIYAEWVLAANSVTRARRYVVADHRNQRLWAKRSIPGTQEEQEMTIVTKQLGYEFHVGHPTMAVHGAKRLAEVDAVLAQPDLALVDGEFTAARGKRRYDVEWFTVGGGPKNIRELAIAVKRLPEYQFFYSKGAEVSHVGSYRSHIRWVPPVSFDSCRFGILRT